MRRAGLIVGSLLSLPSCGGNASDYAAAAATAGVAVALAGANRAATGECWASCPMGTECDEASGTCVPLPCRNACPADSRCVIVEGKEACVRGKLRDVATGSPDAAPGEASPSAASGSADGAGSAPGGAGSTGSAPGGAGSTGSAPDACRGLCFRNERCVTRDGVAECVAE